MLPEVSPEYGTSRIADDSEGPPPLLDTGDSSSDMPPSLVASSSDEADSDVPPSLEGSDDDSDNPPPLQSEVHGWILPWHSFL